MCSVFRDAQMMGVVLLLLLLLFPVLSLSLSLSLPLSPSLVRPPIPSVRTEYLLL